MEAVIISKGWTKENLAKMKTIDFKTKDFEWIFELLGWKNNERKRRTTR
ncbi:MAG TPA: hypothetical protein VJG30_03585 [Candidatus Nanoarchaeia archaeon]|nr:hypothetical protein [Candidatus Nanoarchaeia archaeon]